MALIDRKIPILTGINDVPSITGGATHPNASLLCKNYNDLIDNELTALDNTVTTLQTTVNSLGGASIPTIAESTYQFYVDAVNGSDTATGGYGEPFLTLSKALSIVRNTRLSSVTIYLDGVFNITSLDLSDIVIELNRNSGNGSGFNLEILDLGIEFRSNGTGVVNFIANTDSGYPVPDPFKIIPPLNSTLKFSDLTINIKGSDRHIFRDMRVFFNNCHFYSDVSNQSGTGMIEFYDCNANFKRCSFNYDPNLYAYPVLAYNCLLYLENGDFDNEPAIPSSGTSKKLIKAYICKIVFYTANNAYEINAKFSDVYLAVASGKVLADYALSDVINNVKVVPSQADISIDTYWT